MLDNKSQQPITEGAGSVAELIREIQKTKKILRMYPPDNPVYTSSLDSLFSKFSELLKAEGELRLKILQKSILHNNEQVYHNPDREDNLALFFFKDGVRELTFSYGLTRDELEGFMKILTSDLDPEQTMDDVVTLLWETEFEHIDYTVDELHLTDKDVITEDRIYNEIKEKHAKDNEALNRAYNDALTAEKTEGLVFTPLDQADIENVLDEIKKQEQQKSIKFITILFELLYLQTNREELRNIITHIKSTLEYCVLNGDFKNANYLLKLVRANMDKKFSPDMSGDELKTIYDYINRPLMIEELGRKLDTLTDIDREAFLGYIRRLSKTTIPHFINLLGDVQSLNGRQLLLDALTELGKQDIKALAEGLRDTRWEVVKDILYILGRIGTSGALEYLTHTFSHPDERIRREAVRVIGTLNNPNAFQYIKNALNDRSPSVRITAVRALGNIKTEGAKKVILAELSKKDFQSRDLNEKKEFYRTIAQWHDQETKEFLINTLMKKPFLKKKKKNETRACAALALGMMRAKDAIPALKNASREGDDLLKEYSISALERISS